MNIQLKQANTCIFKQGNIDKNIDFIQICLNLYKYITKTKYNSLIVNH